jgi:hypothetical protein
MELISKEPATDSVFFAFGGLLKVMASVEALSAQLTDFNIMIVAEVVAHDLSCLGSKVFTVN